MRQQYWLHDVFMLEEKMEIDWTVNRSWGHVSYEFLSGRSETFETYNSRFV